jgi:hypothetical protein
VLWRLDLIERVLQQEFAQFTLLKATGFSHGSLGMNHTNIGGVGPLSVSAFPVFKGVWVGLLIGVSY